MTYSDCQPGGSHDVIVGKSPSTGSGEKKNPAKMHSVAWAVCTLEADIENSGRESDQCFFN